MATEKRLIAVGDVLYILGKYSFSPSEDPQVVEVQVAYSFRKQFYGYPTKGHGTFKFTNSDLGKTVFYNREDAEGVRHMIDTMPTVTAVDVEQYKELLEMYHNLRENFIDYYCSGIPNVAPYCLNRCKECVDKHGWCKSDSDKCNGFNPAECII